MLTGCGGNVDFVPRNNPHFVCPAIVQQHQNGRQRQALWQTFCSADPRPPGPDPFPVSFLTATRYLLCNYCECCCARRPNSKTWMMLGMAIFPDNRKNFPFSLGPSLVLQPSVDPPPRREVPSHLRKEDRDSRPRMPLRRCEMVDLVAEIR